MAKKKSPANTSDTSESINKKLLRERRYMQKILTKNENHVLFTGFVFIIMAMVIVAASHVFYRGQTPIVQPTIVENEAAEAWQFAHKSTHVATTDSLVASISDVTEIDTADPAFAIADTDTFLIMKLSVTNTTNHTQDFYPVKQLYVRSSDGDYYSMHATIHVTDPIQPAQLKPGESISGQVSFAIPKILHDPLVYVDAGWNDVVPVVFHALK